MVTRMEQMKLDAENADKIIQNQGKVDETPAKVEEKEVIEEKEPEKKAEPVKEVVKETPVVVPPVVKKQDEATWEQKYNTLQGMVKAQIRDGVATSSESLNKALQKKDQVIETLITQANETKARIEALETKPAEPGTELEEKPETKFDKEDFDGYGPEMGEVAETLNKLLEENKKKDEIIAGLSAKVDGVDTRFGNVDQAIETVSKKTDATTSNAFFTALDGSAPGWREHNVDGDTPFNGWQDLPAEPAELAAGDTFGSTRRQILSKAYEAGDLPRVAKIFNDGMKAIAGKTATTEETTTGETTEEAGPSLEDQAVPDTTGSGQVLTKEKEKVTVTPQMVTESAKKLAQITPGSAKYKAAEKKHDELSDAFQKSLQQG